jgi:hypothetical protein
VTVPKRTLKTNPPDPFNLYDPGNRDVTVTAAGIGTDYNLAVNTTFDVDGYDATVFQAKNTTQAMSGGSSRDIQVVAQADLDKLLADLTKELTDKAKSDIKNQAGSDYQISDQAIKVVIASKTYDKKVGDEATEVSLSLALSATAATYSGQDLKELLSKILEQKTPDGYELASEGLQTSAELQNVEGSGDLTFLGRVRANLIPKFDRDELAGNLAGKKPAAAESYLKEIPSVVSYEVDIWPHLPEFFRAFPRDTKRIHIQVTVQ